MSIGRKIELPEDIDDQSPIIGRKIEFNEPQVSRLRSLISAFPKGLIKGESAESLLPNLGPVPKKLGHALTEKFLPTQEAFPEQILERSGKLMRSTIGAGGGLLGTIGRSLLGGALGETTKQMGGGEGAQIIAEIGAFGLPGLGRKIIPTKAQKKLIDLARRSGMSEEQIAPLLSSQKKRTFLGKVAAKGEKTQRALSETRHGIGDTYEFIKNSPDAAKSLSRDNAEKFLRDSAKIAYEMPFQIRNQLEQDVMDFLREGPTGKNLINLYQDISSRYKIGREHLERLKGPILEALQSLDPQLSEDFQLTNEMFKKRLAIGKTLKPNLSSELMDLGELGILAKDLMSFSMKGLTELLGIAGGRRLAREMLINPRLQNINRQMIKAANERKFPVVIQLANYLKKKYGEKDSIE